MMAMARLPDGRSLAIGVGIADRVSCGALVLDGVAAGDPGPLAAEVAALEAILRARHAGREPSAIDGLREARALYKSFGMDPSRHRPSSEALLRRVLQGKGLYQLGNVVDACNFASLSFLLPIGLYDLARIRGDIELRVGAADEQYAGIRKDAVHVADRLALFDALGPFGSPTSDSLRTCADAETTALLAVVMATADYPAPAMSANLDLLAAVFARHCGARPLWRVRLGPGGEV
jgi:DNA/RNA-binding domain of Phe-tRNA-synthetase-like protein